MVLLVAATFDQPRLLSSVNEADGAVMAERKVRGDLSDGWSIWSAVALDSEQKLMLARRQSLGRGLFLAPAQEATEV